MSEKIMKMYGKCVKCGNNNIHVGWCRSCDPQNSVCTGNQEVDDFFKTILQSTSRYEHMIEWIPFDRFEDQKIIGKGGFSTVYSAIWLDGKRESRTNERSPPLKIALKNLSNSQNISADFLQEIKIHHKYSTLKLYGLTQNPTTKDYMMVLQFAEDQDLRAYLSSKFKEIKWADKLFILWKIANELCKIHKGGYTHRDLHTGNILLYGSNYGSSLYSCISDLGLARPAGESTKEKGVYGVLPYVAPEILNRHPYTTAADIYSFGIIMTEVSSGKSPYGNIPHNANLAVYISNGLRPEFAEGTPDLYIQLAKQCMDAIPSKRPTAEECRELLNKWCDSFNFRYENTKDEIALEIRKKFEAADAVILTLPAILQAHPEAIYTSRLLNFENLPKPVNSTISQHFDSKQIHLFIPEDNSFDDEDQ